MTPSLEGWPTKAKEAPSPHEVRLAPLDTNPIFQGLRGNPIESKVSFSSRIGWGIEQIKQSSDKHFLI